MRKFAASLFSVFLLCASVAFVNAQVGGGVYGPPSLPVSGGTMTGNIAFPSGTQGSPSLSWASTATGIHGTANGVFIDVAGTAMARFQAASIQVGSGTAFAISSTSSATATADVGVSRAAAGILAIGNGTPGDSTGTVRVNNLQLNKITQTNTNPGAALVKLEVVTGTNAGSCKLIVYAGTSNTPATLLDNIGSGC